MLNKIDLICRPGAAGAGRPERRGGVGGFRGWDRLSLRTVIRNRLLTGPGGGDSPGPTRRGRDGPTGGQPAPSARAPISSRDAWSWRCGWTPGGSTEIGLDGYRVAEWGGAGDEEVMMPIYEFLCGPCNRIFSFHSFKVDPDEGADLPQVRRRRSRTGAVAIRSRCGFTRPPARGWR